MSTGKITTPVVEDGAPKHKNWRLKEEKRSRSGMLMRKMVPGRLQVVAGTGKRPKLLALEDSNGDGHQKTTATN
jgi:hypothetical protein